MGNGFRHVVVAGLRLRGRLRSLRDLCERIETLSTKSVLHPSKCRCLAQSYSGLVSHVISLAPPSSSLQHQLHQLLTALLHILQDGERFVHACTYPQQKSWFSKIFDRSARKREPQWLINKALPITLSTEIFDVHLHDFVWCISSLIWLLAEFGGVRTQADCVGDLLEKIWASADEEDDVKSMQALFNKIGAKGHQQICNLICHRLSESSSEAKLNRTDDGHVPKYLWIHPQAFESINHSNVRGSNESAVVFETRLMGGEFACKQFHRAGDEDLFANEAVVQARLRHANVLHLVCCMESASEGIHGSLVMELMDGDLSSLIRKRMSAGMTAPFSLLEAVDLMLQIANGMQSLHELGIMHRDLKSSNILVSHSPHNSYSRINAKIADFGTSKVKHDTAMYTTKRVGTTIWRAPEVVDDEDEGKYTIKADTYSFAIVCAEIFTGLPPKLLLPCERLGELSKVLKQGRRPELPSSCPPAIASYIEKCWHGDPSERPTLKQICPVLRIFKTCVLLNATQMLALPLQDDAINFEELQRNAAERQCGAKFYHPVFNIPCELQFFRSIQESNFILGSKMKHQER